MTMTSSIPRMVTTILFGLIIGLSILQTTNGHGYLSSPRSRNVVANEDGTNGRVKGVPKKEYCQHCINRKKASGTCGGSYDANKDSTGQPMPWNPQGNYVEGGEISIKGLLTAHHKGHIEMYACADYENPTTACFLQNPLTMISDDLNNPPGPNDKNYPQRGYISKAKNFSFTYRLPNGVNGRVLLQWIYVTANSCKPVGYNNPDLGLVKRGWFTSPGMGTCPRYDNTGDKLPERFWNCAEVNVTPSGPTLSPKPSQSSMTPNPTSIIEAPTVNDNSPENQIYLANPRPVEPPMERKGWCCYWNCCNGKPGSGTGWCDTEQNCKGCGGKMCYSEVEPPPKEQGSNGPAEASNQVPLQTTTKTDAPASIAPISVAPESIAPISVAPVASPEVFPTPPDLVCSNTDEIEMNIKIQGDGGTNKWTLQRYDDDGTAWVDIAKNQKITDKEVEWKKCVPIDACYSLSLYDEEGNGIPTGYYEVTFGDIYFNGVFSNGEEMVKLINCSCSK